MTVRDKILASLAQDKAALCDDCLALVGGLSSRQVAYSYCTNLAHQGAITRGRGRCGRCGGNKIVSVSSGLSAPPATTVARRSSTVPGKKPWHSEASVQSRIVAWLASHGYEIRSVANTATREAGVDITAVGADGRELWVTVKGYPDNLSSTQARHYFAGAVLDAVLYREEGANREIAVGLPDGFATYSNLVQRTNWFQSAVPLSVFWVTDTGEVRLQQVNRPSAER